MIPLLENKQPIHTYGAENSGHYYKAVDTYTVDQNGKIFLWDSTSGDRIDAGRLTLLNIPDQLNVYAVSSKLRSES